ncbi:anaerobic sulfatase maturase [bacterium]|nr:anaerobic sulfatase maturase [bacterium]
MKRISSILIKPVSSDCNARCTYCFYRRPLDPYKGDKSHIMSDDVLESLISQYLKMSGQMAIFSWQGGEPTLAGLDFYEKVIKLEIKYSKPGQIIGNALQTNALLIDEDWASFFKEYNFLMGVSLDGPKEVHEFYRGRGSFERVMEAINILKAYDVEFNILTVISDVNQDKGRELLDFFLSQELFYLQFIPCVERDYQTNEVTPFSVNPDGFAKFLKKTFDKWFNKGNPFFSLRDFENILMIYMGLEPELCQYKKECGDYVVVEYNGDVYPCDFFVFKEWRLGNIMEKPLEEIISNNEVFERFKKLKTSDYEECSKCKWRLICNKGCPRFRVNYKGEIVGHNYLCSAYKEFFSYSEKRFKELASRTKSGY